MITTYKLLKRRAEHYFSPFVYGAIDGTVTTFAVVASSYGANLGARVVLILGFANLIGDGFSMGASAYASGLSERQQRVRAVKHYRDHKLATDKSVRESLTRHFIHDYGFEGEMLDKAVSAAMAKEETVVKHLIRDRLGFDTGTVSRTAALKDAFATFIAFLSAGIIPLIPYLIGLASNVNARAVFYSSLLMTVFSFAIVGLMKGRVTGLSKWRGSLETLLLGCAAAIIAYLIGDLLAGWLI